MSRTDAEIEPKLDEIFQLGNFTFSIKTKELQDADGNSVMLRSQSADVLAYLAEHAGELVTKESLIKAVWADTFVTDDSLVQCIGDIRRALGDSDQRIVQTFTKKGYRLVATPIAAELAAPASQLTPPRALRRWTVPILGGAVVVVLMAITTWLYVAAFGTSVSLGDRPKIAVLAFDDFSTGEDQGYLSDAIAEGIITQLAHSSLIAVTARNSSFRYRGTDTDVRVIGEELGVHYILEGSKQKNGEHLRVTVQLVDAASGTHLWAHTYDQKIGDLFTVQDAITKTVANRIGVLIERPVPGADPDKVTALSLHLQALEIVRDSYNAESTARAMELDRQAIEVDPDAQYGYIGMAHGYRSAAVFGWHGLSEEEGLEKGFAAAQKALEIAPDDPDVHYVLARLYTETDEREEAMAAYNKAIEMNPSASNYLAGSASVMLNVGRAEEAIERLKQAMGIDPFHEPWLHWQMGWALWEIEDCEGALAAMLKMDKMRRGAHRMLAGIYACLGEVEKAQEAYKVFYAEANEPTISELREEWKDTWIAPGSLERFLKHIRIAGMKD